LGFYVRKSVRAGPFRFNLSKSGVGVSAGVPGFRVGTGPRGNYVHAGKGGIYYRASLGGGTRRTTQQQRIPSPAVPQLRPGADVPMEDVTGASAVELVPTGPGDLVEQLNKAGASFPWSLAALVALVLVAAAAGGVAAAVLLVLGLPGVVWLGFRDKARRTVVVFYEVEDQHASWLNDMVSAFETLAQAKRLWRVTQSGNVRTTYQYKVNAGANRILDKALATADLKGPRLLATNIAVPSVSSGRQALHFLPDRLIVRQGRRFSDVSYQALRTLFSPARFIESGSVPRDAQQVDTTWRYVNVKGGPDRRFNNNRQIPVMLYGNLELSSQAGLHWLLQASLLPAAEALAEVIARAPSAPIHTTDPALTVAPN
jgi:Protein of unknown function (DUF4236)